MPNDNSNTQQSGDISALHEVMEALVDAEHYVVVAVRKTDDGHEFQMHYSSPLVMGSLISYAQACNDAWLSSSHGDEEDED